MTTTRDITIIGGGIIGQLTARQFVEAGATVTLIEKNGFGRESSWAGGGILLPLYPWRQAEAITDLVLQSLKLYPALAAQLLAETGLDPEWTPCGMLITQNPDFNAAASWCARHRIRHSLVDAELFPSFNAAFNHPLWLPDIAHARNPRLLKSVLQSLVGKGVKLLEQCDVTGVEINGQRINAIRTSLGQMPVNELVIAGGAWTTQICQTLFADTFGNYPQIAPVKGQMLLFGAEPATLGFMVLDGDRYLIPRRDGKILAGSTVEQADFNKATTDHAKSELSAFALRLLPALARYPLLQHWAGLRPGTENGVPYIGRHPEIANLSINAGHFRNGLVMGPASAELLCDLLLGRPLKIAPEPYQLTRHAPSI